MPYQAIDKTELTTHLLELIPQPGLSLEQAINVWWYSKNNSTGLRLTDIGYRALINDCKLQQYSFDIDHITPTSRVILQLSKLIKCPYYIQPQKTRWIYLHLFGSRQAVELTLYGDLKLYLNSFK